MASQAVSGKAGMQLQLRLQVGSSLSLIEALQLVPWFYQLRCYSLVLMLLSAYGRFASWPDGMRLQELARDLGRPAPALYLFLASYSVARSACLGLLPLVSPNQALSSCMEVPARCKPAVPACMSLASGACCLTRAASLGSAIAGQQQAQACSQQLTLLMQDLPTHRGMQFLHQHQQQHHRRTHQHHHHHSYFDDTRRLLLFGRSVFALYPAEPSREVWLSLLKHLLAPDELSATGKPHDLLLPRSSSGLPMQPKWVSRRVSIQHV